MKFSKSVIDRANQMKAKYSQIYPGLDILNSIGFLAVAFEVIEDMKICLPSKRQKWVELAETQIDFLTLNHIIDDEHANDYMDSIDELLDYWLTKYNLMTERHQEEIYQLLSDFPKKDTRNFWFTSRRSE
jgi:hypothetical protein